MNDADKKEQFAAIDLVSKSFQLAVARRVVHAIAVIDRERDMLRLHRCRYLPELIEDSVYVRSEALES